MKRVGILLIAVALIAGMVSCGGESYALAITSTERGSVITPEEGMFTYGEGKVVNLTAEAEEGYRFISWTGDTETLGNVNAASTTITMNSDYSITANFEEEEMVHVQYMIAAGGDHTAGLTSNGTVVVMGENYYGQ